MVQEDVENRTVQLAVTCIKLTVRGMCNALEVMREEYKSKVASKAAGKKKDNRIKGKQTVKQLSGQGQRISSVDIGDEGVRDFFKLVKKYGVDYAIVKDKADNKDKYTVFFKTNDTEVFGSILEECVGRQLNKGEVEKEEIKPSILEALKKLRNLRDMIPKDREKMKEIAR